jgi:hypothetical protein
MRPQKEQIAETKSIRQPAGVRDGLEKALDSVTREVRTTQLSAAISALQRSIEQCVTVQFGVILHV